MRCPWFETNVGKNVLASEEEEGPESPWRLATSDVWHVGLRPTSERTCWFERKSQELRGG